jgi:hypothetical protein
MTHSRTFTTAPLNEIPAPRLAVLHRFARRNARREFSCWKDDPKNRGAIARGKRETVNASERKANSRLLRAIVSFYAARYAASGNFGDIDLQVTL